MSWNRRLGRNWGRLGMKSDEYKKYLLGDVMVFKNGKKRPSGNGNIPVYGGNGILGYTNDYNNEDCIIIGRVGAYCGSVYREKNKCWVSDNAICGKTKENIEYLYYLLKLLHLNKRHIGTSQPLLTQEILSKIEIILPNLKTQKSVVNILKALDDKIALNQQINNNLEQQAQAIYIYLQKTAVEEISLSHFINIKHGYAFKGEHISSEDNGKVLVTPGNFKIGGGFKEERCKFFSGEIPKDYILKPGSLIVTMTDLSKQADTLGYGAFVPLYSDRIYLHNQRIGLITQTENTLPLEYIYWFLRSYEYHSFIVGSASGSTVKHTSPSRILEQAIPIPERKKMEYLFPVLKKINEQIDLNNYQNCKLKDVRDILLPRLMSGKIDISDINI